MVEKNKRVTEVIKFEQINLPQPIEDNYKNTTKWCNWGTDNLYPLFLLDLYGNSPIHSSIINSKASYIIGNGLKTASGIKVNIKVNSVDTFSEFLLKITKDYLIFNFFCVEVVYNAFNQAIELHHVPAHKVRTNKAKEKFWFCEDWETYQQTITYKRWKRNNQDTNSKLFYFDGYFPTQRMVYPEPEYKASLKSITTDMCIRDFNLNNIRNHFSVSTLITFFMGANVPEDVKKKILLNIKNSYSGENGNKVIVDFQNANGKSAEVKNISPNEWDKAYSEIKKAVSDDIFIGHEVTSPMLFGVKTEGQLGGANELEIAYQIFKANYINTKRNELLSAFNILFLSNEFLKEAIEFDDKPLFTSEVSEALKEKIMTVNELRKEAGLPPISNGDKLLSENVGSSNSTFNSEKKTAVEIIQLTEDDYEKIKHLGVLKDEFDFVAENFASDDTKTVADYILENSKSIDSLSGLKTALYNDLSLDITENDLRDIISKINEGGLVKITIDNDSIAIDKPDAVVARKTEVMYSYDVRAGLGSPIIKNTRAFCSRLVTNNRYYTRDEIQSMSEIFGYDVYKHCGGFYHNPADGTTTPYCRHQWAKHTVVKKNK